MDDFLTPVTTVRKVKSNIERFETLSLRENQAKDDVFPTRKTIPEISDGTTRLSNTLKKTEEIEQSVNGKNHITNGDTQKEDGLNSKEGDIPRLVTEPISSPEQALAILKEQPTEEAFKDAIRYLNDGIQGKHNFSIYIPSASAAQVLNALVTYAIPDRWAILNTGAASSEDKAIRKSLLSCMSSVAGVGVIIARVQMLLTSPQLRKPGSSEHIVFRDTVSFFTNMVYHRSFIRDLLFRTHASSSNPGQQHALWAEATSLFAGSKILNVFMEASAVPELRSELSSWLQDAKDYSGWLGLSIATAATNISPSSEEAWRMLANLLKRTLSLGHKGSC
jgi:hypothetical protein